MPFTAKLSRRFYDHFGDELMAAMRAEMRTEIVAVRAEIRAEMRALKADLIKWMFLFFTGSALANVLLK